MMKIKSNVLEIKSFVCMIMTINIKILYLYLSIIKQN